MTWNGPLNHARRTLLARRSGNEIVLEGRTEEGLDLRWSFPEITEGSFRWRSVSSVDGETWRLREEMHVRRKVAEE